VDFIYLTKQFYLDYINCTEIERKLERPYIMFKIKIDEIDFAIPLRSNINHEHVFWTDKLNKCGLDFSKTLIINDSNYINTSLVPHIRENEYDCLIGKEYIIKTKLNTYIKKYKKALNHTHIHKNAVLCDYSTLQYFHKELNIN
jgi:protein AbiQ